MANIIRVGGGTGNESHKLAFELSKSGNPLNTWYYSDTVDTENSASKEVDYMLYVSQKWNYNAFLKIQGSDDNSTWADIDSISYWGSGNNRKLGSATVTYRFFRFSAYHEKGDNVYMALMVVTEQ